MFHHFWKKIMSKLTFRSHNIAGVSPQLDLMTPTEHKMLLEFMLYNMDHEMRSKIMVNHPRLYNVLFPGTLKVQVSIASDDRVVCDS